jgi:hypothetical protein
LRRFRFLLIAGGLGDVTGVNDRYSTLPALDRIEGNDSCHRDDVQQKHDQKRPRKFHIRF